MSKYIEKAKELRNCQTKSYNCAQAVTVAFADDLGIGEETAMKFSSNFGGGMKMAGTCGAITGGLMVLGLYGINDNTTIGEYYRRLKENHNGMTDCSDLLKVSHEKGILKKTHCDGLILESIAVAEDILKEKGLL